MMWVTIVLQKKESLGSSKKWANIFVQQILSPQDAGLDIFLSYSFVPASPILLPVASFMGSLGRDAVRTPKRSFEVDAAEFLDFSTQQALAGLSRSDLDDILAHDLFLRNLMLWCRDFVLVPGDAAFLKYAALELIKACIAADIGLHSLILAVSTPALRVWRERAASESRTADYRNLGFSTPQQLKTFLWNYFKHQRSFDIRNIGLNSSEGSKAFVDSVNPESLGDVVRQTLSSLVAMASHECDVKANVLTEAATRSFVKVRNNYVLVPCLLTLTASLAVSSVRGAPDISRFRILTQPRVRNIY